jgi:FtsZ-binding cell division protein ZapB
MTRVTAAPELATTENFEPRTLSPAEKSKARVELINRQAVEIKELREQLATIDQERGDWANKEEELTKEVDKLNHWIAAFDQHKTASIDVAGVSGKIEVDLSGMWSFQDWRRIQRPLAIAIRQNLQKRTKPAV